MKPDASLYFGGHGNDAPVLHAHDGREGSPDSAYLLAAGNRNVQLANTPASSRSDRCRRGCISASAKGIAGTEIVVQQDPTASSVKPLNQGRHDRSVGYWRLIPAWQSVEVRHRIELRGFGRCRACCSLWHCGFTASTASVSPLPPATYSRANTNSLK